ncbi:hypothetical protein GCM10020001_119870 [Nonomuraea salmonea]
MFGRVRSEYLLVADPAAGWESPAERWSLDELADVDGWRYDRPHADEHSRGFWLRRT